MSDVNKLFENKTTYTTDDYIKFLEFHNKKYNFSYLVYSVFWSFLFLLCIIISFGSGNRLQGVTMTILLICFMAYRYIRPRMIVDNELKSDKLDDTNSTNTFCFYDKNFEVYNNNGKFTYKYFIVKKVFDTKDFFYLYVSKENAFLISKTAFSIGSSDDFAKFMKEKRGHRYKSS